MTASSSQTASKQQDAGWGLVERQDGSSSGLVRAKGQHAAHKAAPAPSQSSIAGACGVLLPRCISAQTVRMAAMMYLRLLTAFTSTRAATQQCTVCSQGRQGEQAHCLCASALHCRRLCRKQLACTRRGLCSAGPALPCRLCRGGRWTESALPLPLRHPRPGPAAPPPSHLGIVDPPVVVLVHLLHHLPRQLDRRAARHHLVPGSRESRGPHVCALDGRRGCRPCRGRPRLHACLCTARRAQGGVCAHRAHTHSGTPCLAACHQLPHGLGAH